jgi:hypothetical protein
LLAADRASHVRQATRKTKVGFYAVTLETPNDATRLRITHDFDPLFLKQALSGWIPQNPTTYLTFDPESCEGEPEVELVSLMEEYLRLTTVEANVERLHNEEPSMFQELLSPFSLVDIGENSVSRKRAIREAVASLLVRLYNHDVDE